MRMAIAATAALALAYATTGYAQAPNADAGGSDDQRTNNTAVGGSADAGAEIQGGAEGVRISGDRDADVEAGTRMKAEFRGDRDDDRDNDRGDHADNDRHDDRYRFWNGRWWYNGDRGWLVWVDGRWMPYSQFRQMETAHTYSNDNYNGGSYYYNDGYPRRYNTGYRGYDNYNRRYDYDDDYRYNNRRYDGDRYDSRSERVGGAIGADVGESVIGGRTGRIIGRELGREIGD